MKADDFYNAYLVLSENNKVLIERGAKSSAEQRESLETRPTMGVEIVCLAFSVELYIKDLLQAINGKAPRGHNILTLFKKLPEQTQRELFKNKLISENPFCARGDVFSPKKFTSSYSSYEGFIENINLISDGFEKWRYSYESTVLKYDISFALALIGSIKSARKKANNINNGSGR